MQAAMRGVTCLHEPNRFLHSTQAKAMNEFIGVQLHLGVNHVVVVTIPLSIVLAIYLLTRGSGANYRIYYVLLQISAVFGLLAHRTGEAAEHAVARYLNLDQQDFLAVHEKLAEQVWVVCFLLLFLSIVGYLGEVLDFRFRRPWLIGTLLFTVLFVILLVETAHSGGLIEHYQYLYPPELLRAKGG